MPFIQIKSLPYESPKAVDKILPALCRDFSDRLSIPLEHVHATWEYFQEHHYCKGDSVPRWQSQTPHSVLVDLLAPDFNDADTIAVMLECIAQSLKLHADVPVNKIFINFRAARSGSVYDDGEIVFW